MKLFICLIAVAASAMADTNVEKILHDSNDQFTAKMFSEVVKSKPAESVVLSAFSVLSPLAQLAMASTGESHDEILKIMGFPNDNVTTEVFRDVNNRLRAVSSVELKLANRIYVMEGARLNNQFAAVSRDTFHSDVKNVDFAKTIEAAGEINAWVEDNTNHRIKNLVDPNSLGPDTAAVLVNAIYFKGKWKIPFKKLATTDRDFHVSKDKTVKIPMMSNSDDFKYGESKELDAKLLELFYEGDKSSLLIVLPNEIDGINGLTEKLREPSVLDKAVANMYTTEVEVQIPKFKIETTTNLKEVLTKMGCKRLFTPGQARLDNLLEGANNLYISEATQKAYIDVNEEGAEAAAANQNNIYLSRPLPPPLVVKFNADRPFYFVLKAEGIDMFTGSFF